MNAISHNYPDDPGHRGVETSVAAADAIASSCGRLQRMVLFAISETKGRGLTTQELAERLAIEIGSVQPRTTELRRKGLIDDSRQRRQNRNGKRAIVWIATAKAVDHG